MKYTGIAFLALLLLTSCNQNEPAEVDERRDTVVVKEKETEIRVETEDKPAAEPAKKPWEDKMAQYHALRCKMHKGTATVSDRTDQVVLLKDLNDIREKLNKDERFYFNADMVKAEDMSTCP